MFARAQARRIELVPEFLDPDQKSFQAREFEETLASRVIGQDSAVRELSELYEIFLAGLNQPDRPIGTMLLLGPTGSGKTHVVEKAAEALFGTSQAVVKIDCAEFQHSHEISKLIGSPPGYLGHRETTALLTQANIDRYHTEETKLSLVLFDEIEKASDSLWRLLLGILDKATLTLGDNRRVDFSSALIVMTSNLGAREMSELISGGLGFAPERVAPESDNTNRKIYNAAIEAARRNFSPEFMNRLDKVVVFQSLQDEHLRKILDLELQSVQTRILHSEGPSFIFRCSDAVKEILLAEGVDRRYGARHLKRAVERILVSRLSNLVASGQVLMGDFLHVDATTETGKLIFCRYRSGDSPREFANKPDVPKPALNQNPRLRIGGIYSAA